MPGTTPIYSLPYDSLTDPPDGADMGEDLAVAVETELARIDTDTAARLPLANIAAVTVVVAAVDATPTAEAVSWGKTLPGTVYAYACAATAFAGDRVVEVSVTSITSTGCNVVVYRSPGANVTCYVLGIGL